LAEDAAPPSPTAPEAPGTPPRARKHLLDWVAIGISFLAVIATVTSAYYARDGYKLNSETQKTALFSQFQQQYSAVSSRFPPEFQEPNFHPKRGSDDYARLEAYWLFCYSEWYATHRLSPKAYRRLWNEYYTPLIENALNTPSLRGVLEDMIMSYNINRGDYRPFFRELAALAHQAGTPLSCEVQKRVLR
jgi:hypothetical protein